MFWKRHAPRREPPPEAGDPGVDVQDLRAAYDRGRRDERRGRKRHPILMSLTIAAALVGGVVLALAAKEGSFAGGGAAVDQGVTAAAERAQPVVREAADEAQAALRGAGDAARDPAG